MKSPIKNLVKKWHWLRTQAGFQTAPVLTIFRFISWVTRCALRKGAIVKLGRWNLSMFLPARWKGIEKLIFVFRENYESELSYLESALSRGKTFVDVGANLGIYALVASRIVGQSGRVIAFEPSVQSFPRLKQNIALNGITNVMALPAAVSDKTGRAWLYHGPDASQNSLGRNPFLEQKAEEIVTESLDNALRQALVEHVDVMKMDVEGAEELVLCGANRVVTSLRPTIIFEINPQASMRLGLSPRGAWDLLDSLGYDFFVSGPDGSLSKATSPPMNRNVVAVPGNSSTTTIFGTRAHREHSRNVVVKPHTRMPTENDSEYFSPELGGSAPYGLRAVKRRIENIGGLLQKSGFATVEHLRYATGRTAAIRFLNERLRLLESFKITARRDSGEM
ncbi:MAG: hypothetical protein DMG50_26200 [Acidobacteria bacterium]|nr:MAG: hypothetical protein DMG50_26200 [Acidobacteriota bacterium]